MRLSTDWRALRTQKKARFQGCSRLNQIFITFIHMNDDELQVERFHPLPLSPIYSDLPSVTGGPPSMICWQVRVLGPRCLALAAPESAGLKRDLEAFCEDLLQVRSWVLDVQLWMLLSQLVRRGNLRPSCDDLLQVRSWVLDVQLCLLLSQLL